MVESNLTSGTRRRIIFRFSVKEKANSHGPSVSSVLTDDEDELIEK